MTNAVETVTNVAAQVSTQVTNVAAQVSTQVTSSLGKQVAEGRAVVQQGMSWVTEHGITFLVNILMAALILLIGGIVVKLLVKAKESTGSMRAR